MTQPVHKRFEFGTVFGDGGRIVSAPPPREKKFYTPEEVEEIRKSAQAAGENSALARAQMAQSAALQSLADAAQQGLGGLTDAIHAHKEAAVRLALVCAQKTAADAQTQFENNLRQARQKVPDLERNARARQQFQAFLARDDRFALGVCNGCQMFAALQEIVPGAAHWPMFRRNRSEQFEARWGMVEIGDSRSLFFQGMAGSRLPVAIAHGEGRPDFAAAADLAALKAAVAANPDDMDAALALANATYAAGDRDEAARLLLAMVAKDRAWNEGAARTRLLQIFEAIGLEDPWVAATRRKLSTVLFG